MFQNTFFKETWTGKTNKMVFNDAKCKLIIPSSLLVSFWVSQVFLNSICTFLSVLVHPDI